MLRAAFRAVHPFPSIVVALLTVALIPLADRDAPLRLYPLLGGAMLLFQFTIGLVNDLVDLEEDRRTKPWKPLARGAITVRHVQWLAVGCGVLGLTLTAALPLAAVVIAICGLSTGLAYDLWLKETPLSWLPYSLALPLLPIWVYVATGEWRPLLWWAFPLGAALGLALHLSNEAPDVGRAGVKGLPGRLGPAWSRRLALTMFIGVALTVVLVVLPSSGALALVVVSVALATATAAPWSSHLGRDGHFGLLAVGAAAITVLFFLGA
ncbi:MAG: hypothetical protein CVU47_09405 [Chloroflexi bacterium HGW-Chloroflexi-9]|nr:MAG: hypothetical protein CVU47_09405 [Chloroflexi bacterium HGW-Chloroflexi-9]